MSKKSKKVRIFSALEVAKLCGVVNQTSINWIRNGYLKAFTTPGGQYRVYLEDLLDFLKSRGIRIPAELNADITSDTDWQSIMVIDDDVELNNLMTRYLTKILPGYQVFQAFDGFAAGTLISDKHPGFIVLDIDLPGVNGHKLCNTIKSNPSFGKPFVIAVTGLSDKETEEKILAEGADAFFAKPLDLETISQAINDFSERISK
jgi:two-component system OmpR family response regulator